jgi:hypothetical protein
MYFTMTTKLILNCFILLTICCSSAFAQIGDECVVKTTGVVGRCRISSNCPVVQEQAQNGISPTICGYYQLTVPIVCCEINTFAEPNDDTFLNRKPNRPDSSFENREPNNNPDAFVYPDHNNEPARPVVSQYLSKSEQSTNFSSILIFI